MISNSDCWWGHTQLEKQYNFLRFSMLPVDLKCGFHRIEWREYFSNVWNTNNAMWNSQSWFTLMEPTGLIIGSSAYIQLWWKMAMDMVFLSGMHYWKMSCERKYHIFSEDSKRFKWGHDQSKNIYYRQRFYWNSSFEWIISCGQHSTLPFPCA